MVCLSPEHATEISKAGFTRAGVRNYLFEHCRLPVRELKGRGYYAAGCWPDSVDENDPQARVPMVSAPEHFWIVVAGGDGRHSAWMPAWNVCKGATVAVA